MKRIPKRKRSNEFEMVSDILSGLIGDDAYSTSILEQLDDIYEEVSAITEVIIKPTDLLLIEDVINKLEDYTINMLIKITRSKNLEDLITNLSSYQFHIEPKYMKLIIRLLVTELYFGYIGEELVGKGLGLDSENLKSFYIGEFVYEVLETFNLGAYEDMVIKEMDEIDNILKDASTKIPEHIRQLMFSILNYLRPLVYNEDGALDLLKDFYMLFRIVELENESYLLICYGVLLRTSEKLTNRKLTNTEGINDG